MLAPALLSGEDVGPMEVYAWGDQELLCRPRADCGLRTGKFCDFCKAKDREPREEWHPNQFTPLCTDCDRKHDMCHFCRGLHWCTPPTRETPASSTPADAQAGAQA